MSRFYQINNVNLSQCRAKHYTITPQKQINTIFHALTGKQFISNIDSTLIDICKIIFLSSHEMLSKFKLYRNDFLSKNILSLIFLPLKIIVIRSKTRLQFTGYSRLTYHFLNSERN